jgi:hypothetical protein
MVTATATAMAREVEEEGAARSMRDIDGVARQR